MNPAPAWFVLVRVRAILEPFVIVLTGATLLGVGALVALGSVVPIGPSGIPDVAVRAALDTQDWLQALRARARRTPVRAEGLSVEAEPARPAPTSSGGEPPAPAADAAPPGATTSTAYFDAGERRFAVLIEREGRPVVLSFFVHP